MTATRWCVALALAATAGAALAWRRRARAEVPRAAFAELRRLETDQVLRAAFLTALDQAIVERERWRTEELEAVDAAAGQLLDLLSPENDERAR
ncbi:hypothetical protein [Streptomyces sp. WMMC897]|uniref:hypothetical protein n=1 Tax=Streptomyces sp. WMMC897 TaxID=3014782 RepID=UPI0022B6B7AB|nr:hypothetical protein [Streptomyces sp. WMMC897]MCZ7414616.1 hypothetical protein [Streptomyces sp. WMMC897]